MVNKIICMAGMKRHKGSLFGIAVLLFLAALSLTCVLTVYLGRVREPYRMGIRCSGYGCAYRQYPVSGGD